MPEHRSKSETVKGTEWTEPAPPSLHFKSSSSVTRAVPTERHADCRCPALYIPSCHSRCITGSGLQAPPEPLPSGSCCPDFSGGRRCPRPARPGRRRAAHAPVCLALPLSRLRVSATWPGGPWCLHSHCCTVFHWVDTLPLVHVFLAHGYLDSF